MAENKFKFKVLFVEDDPILGKGIHINLELESYQVRWVQNIRLAQSEFEKEKFDLAILDLGLPDGHGLDLCSWIRTKNQEIPVLILTAQTDEQTVVQGLLRGANDFVKKPFSQKELMARIKNLVNPPWKNQEKDLVPNLLVSAQAREVRYKDRLIDFNRREFDIFNYLLQRYDQVVRREDLVSFIDKDGDLYDRTVDSHISHIRTKLKKLEEKPLVISSVYGIGYRLEKP